MNEMVKIVRGEEIVLVPMANVAYILKQGDKETVVLRGDVRFETEAGKVQFVNVKVEVKDESRAK